MQKSDIEKKVCDIIEYILKVIISSVRHFIMVDEEFDVERYKGRGQEKIITFKKMSVIPHPRA